MAVVKVTVVAVFVLIASGCTEYGAWDLLNQLVNSGDVLDSLYARYTFDNSGAPATDDSGNGFDGTLNGATWVNDGLRGGVLEFNGTSDFVDLPFTFDGAASELTITAWINITSLATINAIFAVIPISPRGIRFYTLTDGTLTTGIDGNTPFITGTAFAFNAGDFGTWFHVAAVYSNPQQMLKLFINGQREAQVNLTTTNNVKLGPGRFGGRAGPPPSWFDGRIDDLRLYSRTLSDAEIRAVYLSTS